MLIAVVWFWRTQRSANRKTIYDFPNKGDPPRSHYAEWKGANFDRLLSKHVGYGRSANAIDETRADFDRVPWGPLIVHGATGADQVDLVQLWFAGNHSDVGGSYPETESRLSDIALQWMCEQATAVPDGLKTGPIFVHGVKMTNTGEFGQALNVFPSADGVQHCEIAGMRDALDGYAAKLPKWRWLQSLVTAQNWPTKIRKIDHNARLHPTVKERAALAEVLQCADVGPYRPAALREHDDLGHLYPK
jgi:uncharacterized protein (DUF2235 family)